MTRRRRGTWSILRYFGFGWHERQRGGARKAAGRGISFVGNGGSSARWTQPRNRKRRKRR